MKKFPVGTMVRHVSKRPGQVGRVTTYSRTEVKPSQTSVQWQVNVGKSRENPEGLWGGECENVPTRNLVKVRLVSRWEDV